MKHLTNLYAVNRIRDVVHHDSRHKTDDMAILSQQSVSVQHLDMMELDMLTSVSKVDKVFPQCHWDIIACLNRKFKVEKRIPVI